MLGPPALLWNSNINENGLFGNSLRFFLLEATQATLNRKIFRNIFISLLVFPLFWSTLSTSVGLGVLKIMCNTIISFLLPLSKLRCLNMWSDKTQQHTIVALTSSSPYSWFSKKANLDLLTDGRYSVFHQRVTSGLCYGSEDEERDVRYAHKYRISNL